MRPTALIADTRFKGISIGGTIAPYAPSAWGGEGGCYGCAAVKDIIWLSRCMGSA